jgi:outer membrane murein-binding lipoprotein Lpp
MSSDAELRGRVEQLEVDRDTLYSTFRAVDGEFHDAIARHRADRQLMNALRATQIEHGEILGSLVTQVTALNTDVAGLKTDVAGLKTDVAGLKTDVAGLKTVVAHLVTDLTSGQQRIEGMLSRVLNVGDAD